MQHFVLSFWKHVFVCYVVMSNNKSKTLVGLERNGTGRKDENNGQSHGHCPQDKAFPLWKSDTDDKKKRWEKINLFSIILPVYNYTRYYKISPQQNINTGCCQCLTFEVLSVQCWWNIIWYSEQPTITRPVIHGLDRLYWFLLIDDVT